MLDDEVSFSIFFQNFSNILARCNNLEGFPQQTKNKYNMIPIKIQHNIDDLPIMKFVASEKIGKILDFVDESGKKPMIKTSSTDQNTLINLFTQMLNALNLKVSDDNVKNIFNKIAEQSIKTSSKTVTGDKKEEIKIVSKHQKDSHYQIDISKDLIVKNNRKIHMVSCYARDAYLGKYLIKRNFYFTQDREKFADDAYEEISLKMSSLKDRYYNDILDISGIFAQMKKILDGVVSEIKLED